MPKVLMGPGPLATTTAAGSLSATDKQKLNNIDLTTSTLVPIVSSSDNGKILQVNNGVWSAQTLTIPTLSGATSSAAGTAGLVPASTINDTTKFLRGDGTWGDGGQPMVILSYGNSTWAEFEAAYNNNVIVYCRASSNSNPASGSQTRMAFMAYVNNATTPTEVEFQYYRSMSSHSATAMGDQVFVYKLTKTSGWSVTTRDASIKQIKAGTDGTIGVAWSSNVVTLSNNMTAADMLVSSGSAVTVSDALDDKADKTDTILATTLSRGRSTNSTIGDGSFAFGYSVIASGQYSHAEGFSTTASGSESHTEGFGTVASALASHAEGTNTTASGYHSHAEGYNTTANHLAQHAGGEYNVLDTNSGTVGNRGNYIEIIGNGTANDARSNARALDWDGNEYLNGTVKVGCNADSSGGREVFTMIEFTSSDTVETMFNKIDILPYDKPIGIYISSSAISLLTNGDYSSYDAFGSVLKQQITENDTEIDVYKYTLTYSVYATLILYQKAPSSSSIGTVNQYRMVDDYSDQDIEGDKKFKDAAIMMNHQTVPKLYFRGSNMESSSAIIYANACATSDDKYGNVYFSFYEYGPATSTGTTRSSYYERYSLPAADGGRTGHGTYDILTSKEKVTIAQGGTGAGNASDARDNLGLGNMALKNITNSSVAANKSVSIENVPNGALVVAYISASHKYFGYKRGNANMCPLVSDGSITVASSAGTVTITNGTSSTCYYGIIGG